MLKKEKITEFKKKFRPVKLIMVLGYNNFGKKYQSFFIALSHKIK